MISLFGRCLALLFRWGGIGWLVRNTVARKGVSIVVYHDPDRDVLAGHLEYLRRRYSVIPLGQLVEALRSGDWDAVPPKSVVVNFDDGRAGNFELLELFRRYRVEPTVFLCTQIVATHRGFWFSGLDPETTERLKTLSNNERLRILARERGFSQRRESPAAERQALSRQEIDRMKASCDFQSHTRFHPTLTTCTKQEAWEEIAGSKREVEALAGRTCEHFAYPGGAFSDREAEMAEKAGYLSARTVDIGWNHPGTDPYRLRILSIDSPSTTMLAAELSGLKWLARLVSGKGGGTGNRVLA